MPFKLITVSICALLGIQVRSEGVVRIDLERKLVDRFGNIMLSDTVDVDNIVIDLDQKDPHTGAEVDIDLLIDSDVDNYSILREQ
jgi:hypothetical protein